MDVIHEDLITTDAVPYLSSNGVSVSVLRTDKIHPVISGNKWFKLKYYIAAARRSGKTTIITFGGAYSNHIVATAAACNMYELQSIGIIRGEAPQHFSHTLLNAQQYGMRLHFVSRTLYKEKIIPDCLLSEDAYIIPEGGYGTLGAAGVATIPYDHDKFDVVCCAVGTGTMMAGLINAKKQDAQVIGFSVLKNNYALEEEISKLVIHADEKIYLNHDFHFGGYAKYNAALISFMNELYRQTNIPTDFVYTAKLFYGVGSLIQLNYFEPGKRIVIIHCGGLQGNLSLGKGTLIF